MKNIALFAFALVMMLTSCRKHDICDTCPPPAEPGLSDARTVLLKQILEPPLPSPYYELEYNDSNFVTRIGFASRFYYWDVLYENKRVKKLINNFGNTDSLVYTYSNGRVAYARHYSSLQQTVTWHDDLTYNNAGQLQQIRWWRFTGGKDSVLFRKAIFKYQPDGNLAQFDDYYQDNVTGQVTQLTTTTYKDYDLGTNVDEFQLPKAIFFEDLLFLPQVRFQKNNPRHVTIDNTVNHFEIDYSYQYNAKNVPSSKTYNLIQTTKSSGVTQTFTGRTDYLY